MAESGDCTNCPLHCLNHQKLSKTVAENNLEIHSLNNQLAESQVNHLIDKATYSLNNTLVSGLAHGTSMLARTNMELENRNNAMKQVCVDLQAQVNNLNKNQIKMEARLKEQEDTQWSLHTREGVKRLCKYMKSLDDDGLDEFIEENKNSDKPLTLTKEEIKSMIEYRAVLSDYLSCYAHAKFKIDVIKKFPDHLKDVSDDDNIEFKYAGSRKDKTIRFNRKLVNKMIFLLDKGYGTYLEDK